MEKCFFSGAEALWSIATWRSSSEARGEVRPGSWPTVEELRRGPLLFPRSASEDYEREIRGSMAQRRGEDLEGVKFLQLWHSSRKRL
jgi:hypothetical protein